MSFTPSPNRSTTDESLARYLQLLAYRWLPPGCKYGETYTRPCDHAANVSLRITLQQEAVQMAIEGGSANTDATSVRFCAAHTRTHSVATGLFLTYAAWLGLDHTDAKLWPAELGDADHNTRVRLASKASEHVKRSFWPPGMHSTDRPSLGELEAGVVFSFSADQDVWLTMRGPQRMCEFNRVEHPQVYQAITLIALGMQIDTLSFSA